MSGLFSMLTVVAFIAMIVFIIQARKKRPGAAKKAWLSAGAAFLLFPLLAGATMTPAERQAAETRQAEEKAAADRAAADAERAAAEAKAKREADEAAKAAEAAAKPKPVETPAASDPTPEAGVLNIVSNGYFGCADKDIFEEAVGYAVQKDEAAFTKFLGAGLATGVCTTFEQGEKVFLEETSVFAGMIQVRREGDTTKYWTNLEAAK